MTSPSITRQSPRLRRQRLRSLWVAGLQTAVVAAIALALWFMADSGGFTAARPLDYLYSAGRVAGILAAVLVMVQVLLISRSPWIERAVGHDTAARWHTTSGKVAVTLMLVHAALISAMTGYYEGNAPWEQSLAFAERGWHMVATQVGLVLFLVVLVTSLAMVWRRWRYETWYTVHLVVYIAIAAVVPHQFLEGTTFRVNDAAAWFWAALYVVAFGSFLAFRVLKPLIQLWRYRMRVAEVIGQPDGSTTIVIAGRRLSRLRAQPGQFFLWRFLDRTRGRQAHPFSLSGAPDGDTLRITVKPSGDMTGEMADLAVGTPVVAEGPFGVFTDAARTREGTVWVAAGIGVTPVRAMLEEPAEGPRDVIVRASSAQQAPLLDELRELSATRDFTLHVLVGARGAGWAPADQPHTLSDLIPDVAERDVYVCGPTPWADAVAADARAAGVPRGAIHRERFAW